MRGTLSGVAVLAIDTSAAVAVSLCDDDGALLAARRVDSQREHAELLAPMVRDVLAEAGLAPADLVAVVAGTGPAPFTGLRAGLVTARMIALAREVPLHGVSALDALAAQVLLADDAASASRGAVPADDAASAGDLAGAGKASEVLVVTDARRREVYAARFRVADGDVVTVAGPFVDKPDVVAEGAGGAVVVGAGAALYPEVFPEARGPLVPDPAVFARLAITRASRGADQPAEPLYLRRPDVTPAAGRKRATA